MPAKGKAAARPAAAELQKACKACSKKLEKAAFSVAQWKKDGDRQCKACLEAPAKKPDAPAAAEAPAEPEAPASPGSPSAMRPCASCKAAKPKADFSGGQWKKKDAERKCKACTEAEEALLAPAAEEMKRKEEQRKAEEAKAREQEELVRKEALMNPDAAEGKVREKRAELVSDKVLRKEGTLEEYHTYAVYLDINIDDIRDDHEEIHARLHYTVRENYLKKTAHERALSPAYISSLAMDDLKGLACELDIYEEHIRNAARKKAEPEITKSLVTDLIKNAAKEKANKRLCTGCDSWCKKADFGQNQWKKTTGSKCKACMQKEEDEREFFEQYEKEHGKSKGIDAEEVYTSQANLYETLSVAETANQVEIKAAYKKLAIRMHPDRWAHKPDEERLEAETQFKLISEAFETLSDTKKKVVYDKELAKKQKKAAKKAAAAAQKE